MSELESRLTPIKFQNKDKRHRSLWRYLCQCGNTKVILKSRVDYGGAKSCGCLRRERTKESNQINKRTHGETTGGHPTKEYKVWYSIKQRCYNPKDQDYALYGGRGITMYKPWIHDYVAFRDWLVNSIGRAPSPKYSMDRIEVDKNYEPGNLRWATSKEQANNRRKRLCITNPVEIDIILKFRQDKLKGL